MYPNPNPNVIFFRIFQFMIVAEQYGSILGIYVFIHLSIWAHKCILVCLKIMDSSVYFNENYFIDTQVSWIVWQKSWLMYFVLMQIHKGTFVRMSFHPSVHPSIHCTSICLSSIHNLDFWTITWVIISRFSPNLVCELILWRSGLGLLMGKFRQFLTELSVLHTIVVGYSHFVFILISVCSVVSLVSLNLHYNQKFLLFSISCSGNAISYGSRSVECPDRYFSYTVNPCYNDSICSQSCCH